MIDAPLAQLAETYARDARLASTSGVSAEPEAQLTVPFAHRVMREMGVRFNDFGTFARANRWARQRKVTEERTQAA